MVVVLTDVDGWWARIDDLKLRWPTKIAALFRPDEAEKTMITTRFFLYSRVETFLWWCGGWRRPESGDRMRERERRRREERGSLRSATVWTRAWCNGAVGGCEPLDRSWSDGPDDQSVYLVWRGALKSRYTGWRGATGSKLRLFQGLRCVWVLIWCDKPYCILLNQQLRSKLLDLTIRIYLIFFILFLIKISILFSRRNSKKNLNSTYVISLLFFLLCELSLAIYSQWHGRPNHHRFALKKKCIICFRCTCYFDKIFYFILFLFFIMYNNIYLYK
jgi:hypothetical protein